MFLNKKYNFTLSFLYCLKTKVMVSIFQPKK